MHLIFQHAFNYNFNIQHLKQTKLIILISQKLNNMEKSCSDISASNDTDLKQLDFNSDTINTNPNLNEKNKKTNKKNKSTGASLVANLSDTKYSVVKKVFKNILHFKITRQPECKDWDIFWTDNMVQPEQLAKLKNHQKINHFPGMFTLSRKNYLARNLLKMFKRFPQQYQFYPKTWILPSQLNQLKAYMQSQPNCVVIAKPQASSQGRGIFLTKNTDDFEFGEHYVVQKYMKKPFLLDGLKFDLRVYVLVAGCDPLRVYIYKQGLARFATEEYVQPKKQNLANLFMHLTNYAINKNSQKFQFNTGHQEMDKGHKRSLTAILSTLKKMGKDTQKLWQQIKQIIVKSIISVQPILSHHYISCQPDNYANNMCFQILGFDVIIDSNFKPIILEVNYTPSFSTDTPLDKHIKQNLIKDAILLMNITTKAKNQAVNAKKKQMLDRTLTGKKIWYSKQERQAIVRLAQEKRDKWEDKHLGMYQKAFPYSQMQLTQKYKKFIEYSEQCYMSVTGGNIKRNTKVVSGNAIKEETLPSQIPDPDRVREVKQAAKTNELQKIYKTKFRPMIPTKVSVVRKIPEVNSSNQEQNSTNTKTFTSIITNQNLQEVNKKSVTPKLLKLQQNKIQIVTKENKNQNKVNNKQAYSHKTMKSLKEPSSNTQTNTIYNNKMIYKRPNSAVNRKGMSTVYNITFKELPINHKQRQKSTPIKNQQYKYV